MKNRNAVKDPKPPKAVFDCVGTSAGHSFSAITGYGTSGSLLTITLFCSRCGEVRKVEPDKFA